jgi:hypothetical protein
MKGVRQNRGYRAVPTPSGASRPSDRSRQVAVLSAPSPRDRDVLYIASLTQIRWSSVTVDGFHLVSRKRKS